MNESSYEPFDELEDFEGDLVPLDDDEIAEFERDDGLSWTGTDRGAEALAMLTGSACDDESAGDPQWEEFVTDLWVSLSDDQIDSMLVTGALIREAFRKVREENEKGRSLDARALVKRLLRKIEEEAEGDQSRRIKAIERYTSDLDAIIAEEAGQPSADKEHTPHSSVIPKSHVIPNNKMMNKMQEIVAAARQVGLYVDSHRSLKTRCMATFEGKGLELFGRQEFTEYDRSVYNSVISLYVYGSPNHVVTPAEVYRAMVNGTNTETPSSSQLKAVAESLDKMQRLFVKIDCTEEIRSRGVKLDENEVDSCKMTSYALSMTRLSIRAGGRKVTAYKILSEPILYHYAQMTGQVVTIPANLLEIRAEDGSRPYNTEQRIVIRDYLLRRISAMKGKTASRQSRHILFKTLYETVGLDTSSRKRCMAAREYVTICLENWKREGYIRGYENICSGRSIIGVDIKL